MNAYLAETLYQKPESLKLEKTWEEREEEIKKRYENIIQAIRAELFYTSVYAERL